MPFIWVGLHFGESYRGKRKVVWTCPQRNSYIGISDAVSIMDKGSISATVLTVAESQDQHSFAEFILAKFANDDVGNICRTDVTLMKIGKSLWHDMQRNPGKNTEVKKSVPRDMRHLAQLFLTMKQKAPPAVDVSFEQIFNCKHFASLAESNEELTEKEEEQEPAIGFLPHFIKI